MSIVLFWALCALAALGAGTVILTRNVTRLALGLGAFLLAVAGFFALFGFGFLALAELFVYVGGVLVIVLFAIMLVHRDDAAEPGLTSRHGLLAAITSAAVGALAFMMLRPSFSAIHATSLAEKPSALAGVLLGSMLPQFEFAGALLLAGLVAVVLVMGGDEQ